MKVDPFAQLRLLDLQAVDTALTQLAHRRRNLPEHAELEQLDAELRTVTGEHAQARAEVADIQQETPSLTDDVIRGMWTKCFDAAKREAEADMDQPVMMNELTWGEVFEEEYRI